jgi:3-methyladenine DNA glycosylase/8-oxoguanine DNA glycosylase
VPGWLGLDEAPWQLPVHPVTDRLLHEHPGVRLTNTGAVFEALVNTVLHQQVTWIEAAHSWRRLVETLGAPAPGPARLYLPPTAAALRRAGVDRIVALGIGHLRARTLCEVAFAASRLQRAAVLPTESALRLLTRVRGVGPWTAAKVLGLRLGRPEPLVFGDIHLPHTVSWALAGEARGSDARMQELLAPFDGQAFRVVRLIHAAGIEAPRRGPKRAVRFGR